MGITRLSVVAGLAGSTCCATSSTLGARATPGPSSGEFEIRSPSPTALHRRRVAQRPHHQRGPQGHWDAGLVGDTMTVNGTVLPDLRVAAVSTGSGS